MAAEADTGEDSIEARFIYLLITLKMPHTQRLLGSSVGTLGLFLEGAVVDETLLHHRARLNDLPILLGALLVAQRREVEAPRASS
jgi:hypothetical protein